MLARLSIVYAGTIGLDPDKDEGPQLARWLKHHPKREKRVYSEDQLQAMRSHLKKAHKIRRLGLKKNGNRERQFEKKTPRYEALST